MPVKLAKQSALRMWLNRENELFSFLLDEESISNANVLRVSHAILAFLFLISCSESTPLTVFVCLSWFIIALYLCKKGGLK